MLDIIQFLWQALLTSLLTAVVLLVMYALGCFVVIGYRKFKEVWNDDDTQP